MKTEGYASESRLRTTASLETSHFMVHYCRLCLVTSAAFIKSPSSRKKCAAREGVAFPSQSDEILR